MNGTKYHLIPLFAAGLLCALPSARADVLVPPPAAFPAAGAVSTGRLLFCIEQHPGRSDWVTCWLLTNGTFLVYGSPESIRGQLPEQESLRILEGFEKLCLAAGEERFLPAPVVLPAPRAPFVRAGGGRGPPFFSYTSLGGKQLEMAAPRQPPPELTEFMRMLWRKLLHHASKTPRPAPGSIHPSLR